MSKIKPSTPHLHLPAAGSRTLSSIVRHLSVWLIIIGLAAVTLETFYIFNRGNDPALRRQVDSKYSIPVTQFNQTELNSLGGLSAPATIPAASGKSNPYSP